MNRTPTTSDEDLALELGGKLVRTDGSVFNAAGRFGAMRLPKPAPQAAPALPSAPSETETLLRTMIEMVGQMKQQPAPVAAAPEINIPAPVVTVQPAPRVLDWTFTFEHNKDGSIKSIRARATKE